MDIRLWVGGSIVLVTSSPEAAMREDGREEGAEDEAEVGRNRGTQSTRREGEPSGVDVGEEGILSALARRSRGERRRGGGRGCCLPRALS